MVFLSALVFGMALGLVYDIFRIFRIMVRCSKTAVLFQDIFFFLICALSTFLFLLYTNSGEIRLFVLIGEVLGAVFYYFTIGTLVIKSAAVVIKAVRAALRFLARLIYRPVRFLVLLVLRPFLAVVKKTGNLLTNKAKTIKSHLHVSKRMVYNLKSRTNQNRKNGKKKKRSVKRHDKKTQKRFI